MKAICSQRIWTALLAWAACLAASAKAAPAASWNVASPGVWVNLDDSGAFTLTGGSARWTFHGSVGAAVQHCQQRSGTDRLGKYTALAFEWSAAGRLAGEIRVYDARPVVLMVMTAVAEQPAPANCFPTLTPPAHLQTFSYAEKVFAPHSFRGQANATPWLWFDSAGHSAILSPADDFLVASLLPAGQPSAGEENNDNVVWGGSAHHSAAHHPSELSSTNPADSAATVASGFVAPLRRLPAGYSHATVMAFGDSIHSAWNTWGNALTDFAGKHRPANDADVFLKSLGYWTDNGAGYYYHYDPARGYAGTLLALRDEMRQLGVPIRYMQLDSWWYNKTNLSPTGKAGAVSKNSKLPRGAWNCYGGLTEYVANKDLFPTGLSAFQNQLGLPLITHNRWIDVNSPYRQHYNISGVAAIDPAWWTHIIDYIHSCGVVGYEQDWLNEIYRYSPALQSTTTAGDAFTDGMARACAADGLSMQYCMALPRFYLQGTRYDNLTSVRVSDDRFEPRKWESFLYTSQLAAALGEWPFSDCFRSNELGNLLLADLSAGPVGIADLIGQTNVHNLMRAVRPDGVICKPDTPIVPIDRMYSADAADGGDGPMIAAAFTNHGPLRTAYVFAFPRRKQTATLHIRPAELGIDGAAYIVQIADNSDHPPYAAKVVEAGGSWDITLENPQPLEDWRYLVASPVTRSGIALVGDADKLVTAARQRISDMAETSTGLSATIEFARGEGAVHLFGYATAAPTLTAVAGSVSALDYNPQLQQFTFTVRPDATDQAKIQLSAQPLR